MCSQNLFVSYLSTAIMVYNLVVNYSQMLRQPNRTCGEIRLEDIIRILQPLAAKGSSVAQIIQTGIATIIVLEYSAFLPLNYKGDLKRVESAVYYYLKSPTAVAVEQGAKEISRQGYDREELGKKILEFILENRLSKDLTEKK
ncbi:hypothetical protein EV424DRAFT_400979 [Suillus variegatus]|nr:hypothetical protein EV424DRAFT_400979 [Suillus variegatus]